MHFVKMVLSLAAPRLAYWKLGNKPDVIIILHGGPACHHKYLRPELDVLSEYATIFCYDQRGCGKSGHAKSHTWQDHVKDLRRSILTISPRKKVFLLGSLWGSLLAMLYGSAYPQNLISLILTGTVKWRSLAQPYVRKEPFSLGTPQNFAISEIRLMTSTDPIANSVVFAIQPEPVQTDYPADWQDK